MAELPIIHADGGPIRRGRIIGRALADGHARAVDFTLRYTRRHGLADRDIEPLLAPYLAASRHAVPRLVAHLEGVAEGAGLRFIDVFAINAFEELFAVLEGAVPAPTACASTPRRRHRRSSGAPTSSSAARIPRSSPTTSSGTQATTAEWP